MKINENDIQAACDRLNSLSLEISTLSRLISQTGNNLDSPDVSGLSFILSDIAENIYDTKSKIDPSLRGAGHD